MNRQLNTTQPTPTEKLVLSPFNQREFIANREAEQHKQKFYYDRTTRPLPPLDNGDTVKVQKQPGAEWEPAIVVKQHPTTPRSYVVETPDGNQYRRNRRFLLETNEPPNSEGSEYEPTDDAETTSPLDTKLPATSSMKPESTSHDQLRVSRYGRLIKPNPKYMD